MRISRSETLLLDIPLPRKQKRAFGDFDKVMAEGDATMKGATAEEMGVLDKFMKESVLNVSTNRYRLDPKQSYVDAATKGKDLAFWTAKKP